MSNIISQQFLEGEDSPNRLATREQARALLDSPHFTTVIVLKSFLKERLFDGKCSPEQDTAIANSLLHLIEAENISLGNAMEWIEAQPKPKPRSQRVLEDWWRSAQGEDNHKTRTLH